MGGVTLVLWIWFRLRYSPQILRRIGVLFAACSFQLGGREKRGRYFGLKPNENSIGLVDHNLDLNALFEEV